MPTVLVVAGDRHVLQFLDGQLSKRGYHVMLADRGDQAMAIAEKFAPDLIMLDAVMPDATGFQMCSRFRQAGCTKTVPIVMMSPLAGFANQRKFAFERGANEFIPKPLQVIELGDLVDRYVAPRPAVTPAPQIDVERALREWISEAFIKFNEARQDDSDDIKPL